MGLRARVLTAGAAILVASPVLADCHFAECAAMAARFADSWNYGAKTGIAQSGVGPAARTAVLRHGRPPTVMTAADEQVKPDADEMASPPPPRRPLSELFVSDGKLLELTGRMYTPATFRSLFEKTYRGTTYLIKSGSVNGTDLDGPKYALVEWRATLGERDSHRVVALLSRPHESHVWLFDTVWMIPDSRDTTEKAAARARSGQPGPPRIAAPPSVSPSPSPQKKD